MIDVRAHPVGFILEGAFNRGVPNEERVSIKSTAFANTTNLGLMVGFRDEFGMFTPVPNYLFWFGSTMLPPRTTINVFTGGGRNTDYDTGNGLRVHNVFWGLDRTIFTDPNLVPLLFRVGEAVAMSSPPPPPFMNALPQPTNTKPAEDVLKALGMDVESWPRRRL